MTNLSKVSQGEVSENQVIRSRVAETQQPDAERLNTNNPHTQGFSNPYVVTRCQISKRKLREERQCSKFSGANCGCNSGVAQKCLWCDLICALQRLRTASWASCNILKLSY